MKVFEALVDYLVGSYFVVCRINKKFWKKKKVRQIAATFQSIGLFIVLAAIVGFLLPYKQLIIFDAILTSILAITLLSAANFAGEFIGEALGIIPKKFQGTADELKKLVQETRKLFEPLCIISLASAFIASLVSINGFNPLLGFCPLWIAAVIALFFSVFGVYMGAQRKWPGIVMMIVLIATAIFNINSIGPTIQGKVETSFINSDRSNLRTALDNCETWGMTIEDSVTLYSLEKQVPRKSLVTFGKDTTLTKAGTALEIPSLKKDKGIVMTDSGKMLKVRLTNSQGFPTGDTLLVNPRSIKWGEADYKRGQYLLVKTDGFEYITFYSDKDFHIPTENLYKKTVTFSGFESGDLKWNDVEKGGMCDITPGVDMHNFNRKSCTFQVDKKKVGLLLTTSVS